MGDDSTATARDRLSAIERLTALEPDNSVTQVTVNFFRDENGNPVFGDHVPDMPSEPEGRTKRLELEVPE